MAYPLGSPFRLSGALLLLFVLMGTVYHRHALAEQRAATAAALAPVHYAQLVFVLERIDDLISRTDDELQDDTKAKYRPIQPYVANIRNTLKHRLHHLTHRDNTTEETQWVAEQHFDYITIVTKDFYEEYGEVFGLQESEIQQRLSLLEEELERAKKVVATVANNRNRSISTQTTKVAIARLSYDIIADVTSMYGGRTIECYLGNPIHPFLTFDKVSYFAGDTVRSHVRLIDLSADIPETLIRYRLNGGRMVTLSNSGSGTIALPNLPAGRHTLEIETFTMNKLVGTLSTRTTSHYFDVH